MTTTGRPVITFGAPAPQERFAESVSHQLRRVGGSDTSHRLQIVTDPEASGARLAGMAAEELHLIRERLGDMQGILLHIVAHSKNGKLDQTALDGHTERINDTAALLVDSARVVRFAAQNPKIGLGALDGIVKEVIPLYTATLLFDWAQTFINKNVSIPKELADALNACAGNYKHELYTVLLDLG